MNEQQLERKLNTVIGCVNYDTRHVKELKQSLKHAEKLLKREIRHMEKIQAKLEAVRKGKL